MSSRSCATIWNACGAATRNCATRSSEGSNDLPVPEILDLRCAVAEPCKDLVIVRAEFRGDADAGRRLRKMPRRAVDFQPLAVLRVVDLGDITIGQHVGIVGGFEQGVDRRRDDVRAAQSLY